MQGLVLDALRQHTLPEAVAQQLVHASFPDAVVSVSPPAFKPLPAAQQEQLTNALHAAAAQLLADAKAAGQQVMQYKLEPGREQAAVAELLDAVLWLAPQTPSPLDIGLPAQLLEQVRARLPAQSYACLFQLLLLRAWLAQHGPSIGLQACQFVHAPDGLLAGFLPLSPPHHPGVTCWGNAPSESSLTVGCTLCLWRR